MALLKVYIELPSETEGESSGLDRGTSIHVSLSRGTAWASGRAGTPLKTTEYNVVSIETDTTAADVCRMIAKKRNFSNPEDFELVVYDGDTSSDSVVLYETILKGDERPSVHQDRASRFGHMGNFRFVVRLAEKSDDESELSEEAASKFRDTRGAADGDSTGRLRHDSDLAAKALLMDSIHESSSASDDEDRMMFVPRDSKLKKGRSATPGIGSDDDTGDLVEAIAQSLPRDIGDRTSSEARPIGTRSRPARRKPHSSSTIGRPDGGRKSGRWGSLWGSTSKSPSTTPSGALSPSPFFSSSSAEVSGVSVDGGPPEGYMEKRGKTNRAFKRRFFVILGSDLCYFRKRENYLGGRQPIDAIPLCNPAALIEVQWHLCPKGARAILTGDLLMSYEVRRAMVASVVADGVVGDGFRHGQFLGGMSEVSVVTPTPSGSISYGGTTPGSTSSTSSGIGSFFGLGGSSSKSKEYWYFDIITPSRVYSLRVDSVNNLRNWLKVLQRKDECDAMMDGCDALLIDSEKMRSDEDELRMEYFSESIDRILNDFDASTAYQKYLESKRCPEFMHFWLDSQNFKEYFDPTEESLASDARRLSRGGRPMTERRRRDYALLLYERYVKTEAKLELPDISQAMREEILDIIQSCDAQIAMEDAVMDGGGHDHRSTAAALAAFQVGMDDASVAESRLSPEMFDPIRKIVYGYLSRGIFDFVNSPEFFRFIVSFKDKSKTEAISRVSVSDSRKKRSKAAAVSSQGSGDSASPDIGDPLLTSEDGLLMSSLDTTPGIMTKESLERWTWPGDFEEKYVHPLMDQFKQKPRVKKTGRSKHPSGPSVSTKRRKDTDASAAVVGHPSQTDRSVSQTSTSKRIPKRTPHRASRDRSAFADAPGLPMYSKSLW